MVKDLETHVEELEQYSQSNCLEINGVPETDSEWVIRIFKEVSSSLGLVIDDKDIEACHTDGPKKSIADSGSKPREIMVKFTSRGVEEDLLQKQTVKNNCNTKDIGLLWLTRWSNLCELESKYGEKAGFKCSTAIEEGQLGGLCMGTQWRNSTTMKGKRSLWWLW